MRIVRDQVLGELVKLMEEGLVHGEQGESFENRHYIERHHMERHHIERHHMEGSYMKDHTEVPT